MRSVQFNRLIKLEDAFVDQLMEVKQLAWMARDRGGDASVIVSNGMAGQPLPQEPWVYYNSNLAKMEHGVGGDVADGGRLAVAAALQ